MYEKFESMRKRTRAVYYNLIISFTAVFIIQNDGKGRLDIL